MQKGRDVFRRWLGIKLFDASNVEMVVIEQPKDFVFLRWDAKWGDAIVSSFVFPEIRRLYPQARITVVCTPQMASLFRDYYLVDTVIEVKKRMKYRELKALSVRLGAVDVLVHMAEVLKMKDLYFLNKVQAKIIAGVDDKVNLINLKLGQKTKNMHYADKFITLLKTFNINVNSASYQVPKNEQSQENIRDLLAKKKNTDLVVINPYGNGVARKLSVEKSKFIIDEVLSLNSKLNIALLHSPETKLEVVNICNSYQKDNVFYNENSISIFDSIALIEKANIVISVDTAIVHIASGLNKTILAIYNPGDDNYATWHPNTKDAVSIFSPNIKPHNVSNIDTNTLKLGILNVMKKQNLV